MAFYDLRNNNTNKNLARMVTRKLRAMMQELLNPNYSSTVPSSRSEMHETTFTVVFFDLTFR
jgi:hypothetical protein